MNYKEFVELVVKTRIAQTKYRRFRTSAWKRVCERCEAQLDAEIDAIMKRTGQKDGKSLFD